MRNLRQSLRIALIAIASGVALCGAGASPGFAHEDGWRGHERWEHRWQEREWRHHEWREHHRHGFVPGYVYAPGYVYPPPPVILPAPPQIYAPPPPAFLSFGMTFR